MQIKIEDQVIPLTKDKDGRMKATFIPRNSTDTLSILSTECLGDFTASDIQIEQGSKATTFVPPEINTNDLSGIFKDLQEVRLEIKDTENGLLQTIHINQSGLEQQIKDTKAGLESRIISNAGTYQRELKSTKDGLESQLSQTAGILQSKIDDTDKKLRSVIQQSSDNLITLIAETDSTNFSKTEQLVNGLQSTVQGDVQRLDGRIDGERSYTRSQVTQLKDLISSSIESSTGARSEIWQTLNAHNSQLTSAKGDISRITQRVDSVQSQITTVDGKQSTLSQTVNSLQTKVTDTEKGLRSTIQQTSDNLMTVITKTDTNNFSKTEQLVSGVQTTVQAEISRQASRLDGRIDSERSYTKSQVTQLESLIASSIESSTGNKSLIWQTLNSQGSKISTAQGDINQTNRTVSSLQTRISSVEGQQSQFTLTTNALDSRITSLNGDYSRLTQTVNGLSYDVNNYNGTIKTEFRALSGQISSKVTRSDVQSIIRSSGDAIWFAVGDRVASSAKMSGSAIKSEINLSRDGVRISGNQVSITGSTYIERGVIQDAHIGSISANTITTGTLNAANVRVINFDANNLTGNLTNFVKSNWNNISTQISIDNRGINITGSDQWRRTYFNQTGLELFNSSGADNKAGAVGYFKSDKWQAETNENYFDRGSARHLIGIGVNKSHDMMFGWTNGDKNGYKPVLELDSQYERFYVNTSINAYLSNQGLDFNSEQHRGDFGIQLRWNNGFRSRLVLSENTYLESQSALHFYSSSGQRNFTMHSNNDSWRTLNMHGNPITNQSDERLKRNILPSTKDSLGKFSKVQYKWFEYVPGHGLAKGLKHGVIAQDIMEFAPEWIVTDPDGYYSLDQTAMQMDSFKAITQLAEKVKKLEAIVYGK